MIKYVFSGKTFDRYAEAIEARNDALSEVEPGQNYGVGAFDIKEIEVEEEEE